MFVVSLLLAVFPVVAVIMAVAGETDEIRVGLLLSYTGLGDQSFNDMVYAGVIQSRKEHNFRILREQCGSDPASAAIKMQQLLDQKADVIIASGWEFLDEVKVFAERYPEKLFILNDIGLEGYQNVVSTQFAQHEGSFLAGILAAGVSGSGKVGFIGGVDIPVIRSFYYGFKLGVEYADKNTVVLHRFLGGLYNGFHNPTLGRKEALQLYDLGVDVIFTAAGLSGNGVIRAAQERNKFVIGVDANQDYMAKGVVLTSVMKRLDRAVCSVLDKYFSRTIEPGVNYFNLANLGVSLTPMEYSREQIPAEVLTALEDVKRKIISGEIVVYDYLRENSVQEKVRK